MSSNILSYVGCGGGGGQVVNLLAFYSEDPSSNPADAYTLMSNLGPFFEELALRTSFVSNAIVGTSSSHVLCCSLAPIDTDAYWYTKCRHHVTLVTLTKYFRD